MEIKEWVPKIFISLYKLILKNTWMKNKWNKFLRMIILNCISNIMVILLIMKVACNKAIHIFKDSIIQIIITITNFLPTLKFIPIKINRLKPYNNYIKNSIMEKISFWESINLLMIYNCINSSSCRNWKIVIKISM